MFLTFKLYFYIVYVYVLPANMYVFHVNEELEEGLGSPGTGAKDGFELPRRCGNKPSSVGRASSLLTDEPPLHSSCT